MTEAHQDQVDMDEPIIVKLVRASKPHMPTEPRLVMYVTQPLPFIKSL